MSQNDLVIDNQSFPATRSDINSALQALGSLNSGATAPATTYANMMWYDTANNILNMRSEANDAWISIGTLNQSTNVFEVANVTNLTQTQAEDDTSTVFGQVSGQRLAQAVAANGLGGGQTWQDVSGSRSTGTTYQNTTTNPIGIFVGYSTGQGVMFMDVMASPDNVTFYRIDRSGTGSFLRGGVQAILPSGWYYRVDENNDPDHSISDWRELR